MSGEISWVSGSALGPAIKCAASAVLWRVLGSGAAASRIGSALHDHLRQRSVYGVAAACEMLPELARRHELSGEEAEFFIARAKAFEWSPPRGSIAEIPLCLFEDGRVELVKGGRGQYDELPADALLPAQIDLFWAEPKPLYRDADGRIRCPPESVLWVIDFKSGKEEYVEDAERNPQALASAVLAAKWTGAKMVVPGIVFIRRGDGIWDIPENYLDIEAINHVAGILTRAVLDVRAARAAHRQGLPLAYRAGAHCNMCGARHGCPAHLALIKAYLEDPSPIEPGALSQEQLQTLAELAPSLRAFAASVDAALRTHVEATRAPIVLGDGRVFGPYTRPKQRIDPDKALAALEQEIGKDSALAAAPRRLSLSSIRSAIKAVHDAEGRSKTAPAAFRRVYARLMKAGGITDDFETRWGAHKPPRQLPPAAAQRVIASLEGIPIDSDERDDDE